MIELTVGAVAHGGHCVARHEGRVAFVRHTLPGETVLAEVTGSGPKGRYLFADAVEVLGASPGRREPRCPVSGPGGCGGCDWQHVEPAAQRKLKADVLTEQLRRLGGIDVPITVHPLPEPAPLPELAAPRPEPEGTASVASAGWGSVEGLGWRTRVRYAVARDGRLGFRKHRSHDIQPVPSCVIATPDVRAAAATGADWRPAREVDVVGHDDGVLVRRRPGGAEAGIVPRTAAGRRWEVPAAGFWQVHPGAADALVGAVRAGLGAGDDVGGGSGGSGAELGDGILWDLYAGVGLFAGALASGRTEVHAVESSRDAVACARRNLTDLPSVRVHRADVLRWLHQGPDSASRVSAVVLDPPRRGASRDVIDALTTTSAERLAYVACDPAALGRDVGELRRRGWQVRSVTGFDLFPNTYHVEAVALLGR